MTNKIVSFPQKQFILIRRIISFVAFAIPSVCLCLCLMGFVPFWGRDMGAVAAVNNVFEFINLGKKSFTYCACCITFAVMYVITVIKLLITVISGLITIKQWLVSSVDSQTSRKSTKKLVDKASSSLWWFFLLYILSNLMSEFTIPNTSLAVIVALIVFSVLMNLARDILFKGDLFNSLIKALNNGIILSSMFIFTFLSTNVQLPDLFKSFGSFFSALNAPESTASSGVFLILMLVQQILIPIFNLIMVLSIIRLNAKINNYEFEGKDSVKGILIRNIVFLCIILVGLGYTHRYANMLDYVELIYKNIFFVLMTALIYITALNEVELPGDIALISSDEESSEQISSFNGDAPEVCDTDESVEEVEDVETDEEVEDVEADEEVEDVEEDTVTDQ